MSGRSYSQLAGGAHPTIRLHRRLGFMGVAYSPPPVGGGGGAGTTWYAATTGTINGAGTQADPWDLTTALAGGPTGSEVQPGDTIKVRGGTYLGPFTCTIQGTIGTGLHNRDGKVLIKAYPGETVEIQQSGGTGGGTVVGECAYCWFLNLRVSAADTTGQDTMGFDFGLSGVAHGNKVLHCFPHDNTGNGIGMFGHETPSPTGWLDGEAFGNYVFNNGMTGSVPGTSFGHGIYNQNESPSLRFIRENVVFNQYGYGLHAYSSAQDNLTQSGNVMFCNGMRLGFDFLVGSANGDTITFEDNWLFRTAAALTNSEVCAQIGWDTGGVLLSNLSVQRNRFHGLVQLQYLNPNLTFRDNLLAKSIHQVIYLEFAASDAGTGWNWGNNTYYYAVGNDGIWLAVTNPDAAGTGAWDGNYADLASWQAASGIDAGSALTIGGAPGDYVAVRDVRLYESLWDAGEEHPVAHVVCENPSAAPSVTPVLSGVLANGDNYKIYPVQDWVKSPRPAPLASGTYAGVDPALTISAPTDPALLGGALYGGTTPFNLGTDAAVFVVSKT